jgi:hypothetical protein
MQLRSSIEDIEPYMVRTFSFYPPNEIRIDDVQLTNDDPGLNINYVTVGNIMIAAFSNKKEICDPSNRILVVVENLSARPIRTAVVVEEVQAPKLVVEIGSIVVNLRGRPLRVVGIVDDKANLRDDYTGLEETVLLGFITPENGWAVRKKT